jgi:ribosome-binding ATPase YchF (GTP1/OBG family)
MLIGLVGKPNIGKSTFFKAATLANVLIANYPFATIKPNHGCGYVKISRGAKEFNKEEHPREGYVIGDFRFVPVNIMDVAGLVPGAYEGEGMGNQFLDDLRQAHVLVHVIDASGSTNEKGESVEIGSYDPAGDIRFLEVELDMWYLGILKKGWEKFAKTVQQTHQKISDALGKQLSGLGVTPAIVEDVLSQRTFGAIQSWSEEDLRAIATALRKKTKPIVIAANKADKPGALIAVEKLQKAFPEYIVIPTSAETELALREASKAGLITYVPGDVSFTITHPEKLSEAQTNALTFMHEYVGKTGVGTGVQVVLNTAVFDLLRYVAIFPGGAHKLEDSQGRTLPDCFLMPPGTTALDFAFRLHSDFGKNFIKAIDCRSKLPISKDHVLKNRDIVEIMSNA